MKITSTYSVKIKYYNGIFKESVQMYRSAVDFFIDVCINEWNEISLIKGIKACQSYVEKLSVPTINRPQVKYNFNERFYKMPAYLRRAAINEALGKVSSYKSNLANWGALEPQNRGKAPSKPKAGYCYPALYRGNMFLRTDTYEAQIKVFRNNTWDWLTVKLRKSDVDYILHHCGDLKENSPKLQKRGRQWFLDFSFEQEIKLSEVPVEEQIILAVDLGINNACTCSVMASDGAVLGREFLKLPKEYDSLMHKIGHIKRAQRHGSRKVRSLWKYAKGVNDYIAVKTADFITKQAMFYSVDCIVFEHLDLGKKVRGSKKQRLALWKARYVQQIVTHKTHANGIRISHINAWGTSRLAYDGSGRVERGGRCIYKDNHKEPQPDKNLLSYSACKFQTGKYYNCDLNATYNIGSRYFVRELLKTLPVTVRQRAEANIPGCAKRSTCTLSTLISLNGELHAVA